MNALAYERWGERDENDENIYTYRRDGWNGIWV
jgi:hypothetical protein